MGPKRKINQDAISIIFIMLINILLFAGCTNGDISKKDIHLSDTTDYSVKRTKGVDFTASGENWTLDIDMEGKIILKTSDKEFAFETIKPRLDKNIQQINYNYKGNRNLNVFIKKEDCTKNNSTKKYKVTVSYEMYDLSGCGDFLNPEKNPLLSTSEEVNMLNDIFVLVKMKGNTLEKFEFYKDKPYIEIQLKENRIAGNTGTNTFFGYIEADDNTLKTGNIASTKISPLDDFEIIFFECLRNSRLWKRDGMNLIFMNENGEVLLEFKKVD